MVFTNTTSTAAYLVVFWLAWGCNDDSLSTYAAIEAKISCLLARVSSDNAIANSKTKTQTTMSLAC